MFSSAGRINVLRVRHGACIRSVLSATNLRISVKSTPLRRRDSVVRLSCRYAPQNELGQGVPEMARLDLADPDLHVQRVGGQWGRRGCAAGGSGRRSISLESPCSTVSRPAELEAIDRSSGQASPLCWRSRPREARHAGGAAEQGQMGRAASARPRDGQGVSRPRAPRLQTRRPMCCGRSEQQADLPETARHYEPSAHSRHPVH